MGTELSFSIAVPVRQPPATDGAGSRHSAPISSHLIQKSGFTRKTAQTGAVTLIQRFGSALNLNVHFHMLSWMAFTRKPSTAEHGSSAPTVSEKRLSLTPTGNIRYQLKTPYSDGTTQVIFEPLDFIAKLAALVPKPKVNLTRFHGVLAPNSKHRVEVTPTKRGKGSPHSEDEDTTPKQRHKAMTWAQRLKRVFTKSRRFRRH